jgi:hypothetical protein
LLIRDILPHHWKNEFQQKFISFCNKAPVSLSMVIRIQKGEEGVLVTHANSNIKYFFPFDYSTPVKDFIAKIKNLLVEKHYPRIIEEILDKHEFTQEELAKQLETKNIDDLSKYEMRVIGTRLFRIDKVLLWRNIFIIVLESSSFSDDELGKTYRYKLNISPVIFLRNYRTGKFKSIEEASAFFFSNSVLIDSLEDKNRT